VKFFSASLLVMLTIGLTACRDEAYRPGSLAPDVPHQKRVGHRVVDMVDGVRYVQRAEYEAVVLVVSRNRHRFGAESVHLPLDLVFAWGNAADPTVLSQLKIHQTGRFFFWKTVSRNYPIPRREIISSLANVHIAPGSLSSRDLLFDVREGDLLYVRGALIDLVFEDGRVINTSLTRGDSGAGACEVLYVEDVRVIRRYKLPSA
jgi:hypothetical protein